MLRSHRWLNTQPPRKLLPALLTKPGSAARGSTQATATVTAAPPSGSEPATAKARATPPPYGDVLIEAAKIPRSPTPTQKPSPRECKLPKIVASTPARPPPCKIVASTTAKTRAECKLSVDVGKDMRQGTGSSKPTLDPPLLQSITGNISDISFVGEAFRFKDGASQALHVAPVLAKFTKQMPPGRITSSHWSYQRSKHTADLIHEVNTNLTCNNPDSYQNSVALFCGITAVSSVATSRVQVLLDDGGTTGFMTQNWPMKRTGFDINRRYYSTVPSDWKEPLPAPGPPPDNLLQVMKPCVESETKQFQINVEKSEDLVCTIDQDKEVVRKALDIKFLMDIYNEKVKPALRVRGMISLHSFEDVETKILHNAFQMITGHYPICMTSLDIMENLILTEDYKWTPSLDNFSHLHVSVFEDWSRSFCTSSGYTFYDRGLRVGPNDDKDYIRGECDSSFNEDQKTAKISNLFWRRDQILSCTVFYGIPCSTSIQAEATAMYFLLKTGVIYKNIEVSSASEDVIRVLKGYQKVTKEDDNYDLLMLLRYMRRCYPELRLRLQNRENMLFVESLLKGEENYEYEIEHTKSMIASWASPMRGHPIYIVAGHSPKKIKKKAQKDLLLTKFQQMCYCELEQESHKLSAVWHIVSSLEAKSIHLVVPNFESRPGLEKEYASLFGTPKMLLKKGSYSVLEVPPPPNANIDRRSMTVFILFEPTLATDFMKEDQSYYLVLLSTPNDRSFIRKLNIQHFSPLSFVSVHKSTNGADKDASGTKAADMGTSDINTGDLGS